MPAGLRQERSAMTYADALKKMFTRHPDYPPESLPWPDRKDFKNSLSGRLASRSISPEDAADLQCWNRDGFIVWRGAVDCGLIDELLQDYETAWRERPACNVLVTGKSPVFWKELGDRGESRHCRVMDFHNLSCAAAAIMMHPRILNFIRLLFDAKPVGMQTLFFEYGSEQGAHQDFAYVQADILSHLAAAWVACEDTDAANGPLFYYPGAHRIPKFDFKGGRIAYKPADASRNEAWVRHMKSACESMGLKLQTFEAKKGDVLLWHSAMVHGGSPVLDKNRTRKSLVSHYSDIKAYPADWRSKGKPPRSVELNGGVYYEWEAAGHREGLYPRRTKAIF